MSRPVTLRTTRPTDAERLRALRIEALTLHPSAFASSPKEAAADDWHARARDGGGDGLSAIFVADAGDGELAAMTGILLNDRSKHLHSAFLWGVYVRDAFRGQRLGERLVNLATDWAAAKGRTIVRLGVTTTNAPAIAAYLRCGFSVYGIERASAIVGGVTYDELLMHKTLPPPR